MSLINEMLRDLDARRGPSGDAGVIARQGIGLVRPRPAIRQRSVSFIAAALGAATLLVVGVKLGHEGLQYLNVAEPVPDAEKTQWTRLPLPAPTPRSRATAHRAPAVPAASSTPESKPAKASSTPAEAISRPPAVKADSAPATAVVTGGKQQAAQPVVASAALEPVFVQAPQLVRNLRPEQKAEHQFAQAQHALAEHNWQRAEPLLKQTLELLPGHLEARTQLASLLVARQANGAAEQLLVEGLAIDPKAGALARPYAQLLAARDALQPALDVLAEVYPDAETAALKAAILHRIGDHAEAAGAYESALREQPEQALWWTGLAIAREHNQEPRKALQAYQRAARLQLSEAVRQYVEQRMQALQSREGQ
jgi:Tfp pilus assembly protein PilF